MVAQDLRLPRDATDYLVFELVNRRSVYSSAQQYPTTMPTDVRNGIELILDLSVWLYSYRPQLRLPLPELRNDKWPTEDAWSLQPCLPPHKYTLSRWRWRIYRAVLVLLLVSATERESASVTLLF